jgi:hypothetical protein
MRFDATGFRPLKTTTQIDDDDCGVLFDVLNPVIVNKTGK